MLDDRAHTTTKLDETNRKEPEMSSHDDHVQRTWNLVHDNGDEITIDLLTDDETVRVDGGDGEGFSASNAREVIEKTLLPKYLAAGYRIASAYAVNDPEPHTPDTDVAEDDVEPDHKPERCPECAGTSFDFAPNHVVGFREGDAWLCTGCKWGQWITA